MFDQPSDGKYCRIRHFSNILFVADRRKSQSYYREILGFHCDPDMGFTERDGLMLIIHETPNAESIRSNYPAHGEVAIDLYAMVEGIDDLFDEWSSRGAVIHYPLRTNDYGMREFAIRDPDGYTLGFGEPEPTLHNRYSF